MCDITWITLLVEGTGGRDPLLAQSGRKQIIVEALHNVAHHWAYRSERLLAHCGVLFSVSRTFLCPHFARSTSQPPVRGQDGSGPCQSGTLQAITSLPFVRHHYHSKVTMVPQFTTLAPSLTAAPNEHPPWRLTTVTRPKLRTW